jgi:predicted nucleotidyltransferase component of viral defense system
MLDRDELIRVAAETGFQPESLEKVLRLLEILDAIRSHPFLKSRVALKGGTALNLFVFDVPRLSVDVDLNYIGSASREVMLAERPRIDEALQAVSGRLGIQVKRIPDDHAGGKWRLSYQGSLGRPATLELDVNYMLRTPLWPVQPGSSRVIADTVVRGFPLVEMHELAAGKLAALLSREASRDVFDAHRMLRDLTLDDRHLRLAFVVYGAFNRRDWRTVTLDDIKMSSREAEQMLLPLLRASERPGKSDVPAWTTRLVRECRDAVARVLPLNAAEGEFIAAVNDQGEVRPDVLTDDPALRSIILSHPMLAWKAQNVRQHKGLDT